MKHHGNSSSVPPRASLSLEGDLSFFTSPTKKRGLNWSMMCCCFSGLSSLYTVVSNTTSIPNSLFNTVCSAE
eukprot:9488847-Pyramimonas_sp.AAC.3